MTRMKHIFRKLHLGSSHDPNRSNEISTDSSLSCASDHRAMSSQNGESSQSTPPSEAPVISSSPAIERPDYYASEEEFQVQLAMAISASNSEAVPDLDSDHIRAAALISLGKVTSNSEREAAAESVSRRYWDYNVLDCEEKVIDGFYDVYGLPNTLSSQGRMPSLLDLQSNAWNTSFEAIVVNGAIDPSLEELKQVAHCIALDCPITEVSVLVQRIADLVAEHMGGPVRDASAMTARWMDRAKELRSSLQTCVLPIGYLNVGLSRHRSLLFKVLADHVGLPCRLVKGSYYTGVDDDAVNIIKTEDGREFLVDLMAAPGTVIPADILSMKDTTWCLNDSMLSRDTNETRTGFAFANHRHDSYGGDNKKSAIDRRVLDNLVNTRIIPSVPNMGSSNVGVRRMPNLDRSNSAESSCSLLHSSSVSAASSNRDSNNRSDFSGNDTVEKTNTVSSAGGIHNTDNLFADLNPFKKKANEPFLHGKLANKRVDISPRNVSGPSVSPSTSDVPVNIHENGTSVVSAIVPEKFYHISNENYIINILDEKKEREHRYDIVPRDLANVKNDQDRLINVSHLSEKQGKSFTGRIFSIKDDGSSTPPTRSEMCEKMLDDVAECEILWEDLDIGERIGLGSYGEVYHADWKGTEVAVKKFLDQDFSGDALDEFRREVRIMRRLRHPNVVLFMGAVTRPPNLSIVSEFLPRGSLYRLLHRPNSHIDEKRRIKMALDVAKGMNCLHSSAPTIVHRDLKSANLLVDNNWNVKVCDFGLSRLKHNTFLSSKSTAGTPEWMAPEVLRNEPSNEKCDVYSFGVILWELATLRMPWLGMNPMQVVGAVGFQNRRLDIPKEIDPLVAGIIWECWQTDPNLRPSFAQLASALKPLRQLVVSDQQMDVQNNHLLPKISVNSTP